MYKEYITTQDEAVCHLFLHCCYKDGKFSAGEIDIISAKFVELQMHQNLNFKEELHHYQAYRSNMEDDKEFLSYIIKLINPVNHLALYSYCVELCLGDQLLSINEESLLGDIAQLLDINEEKETIDKLLTQRKAVELEKIF